MQPTVQPELLSHREQIIDGVKTNPNHAVQRYIRFIKVLFTHGPLYAIALSRMTSTEEYDPKVNWDFWTKPTNKALEAALKVYPGPRRRGNLVEKMMKQDHTEGIRFHYDVPTPFYHQFLDEAYGFYTCAFFKAEGETLEQAQKNKADFLVNLLDPQPGQQIRDLGCGWTPMMRRIFENTGTRESLIGYTLSHEQLAFGTNLGYNIELQDFIEMEYQNESIDRFISVGSLEHVRPNELSMFYKKMFNALRSGGRMVNQFFSLNHEPCPPSMLLGQLFFPGSKLVMHDVHIQAAKNAGFEIQVDVTDSYKPTLRAWYNNLVANRDKAVGIVGIKIYNEYLTFFPVAWRMFDDDDTTLHRMLLVKP